MPFWKRWLTSEDGATHFESFNPQFTAMLSQQWALWSQLGGDQQRRIEECALDLLNLKRWEAAHGFTLTDEMRVLIAAQASLLLLNLPDDCYRHVGTIIVHPTTVVLRGERSAGTGGLMTDAPFAIDGQAHFHGPILLAWDAVQRDARFPGRGLNVVFHEFAHQLDMLDGLLDGTPPQADEQAKSRWIDVFTRSYRAMCDTDVPSILREYATTNPAEYFAVATEMFWTRPTDFAQEMPEVFAVMKGFFRFDPAA